MVFLHLFVFNPGRKYLLLSILDLGIWHHAPEGNIAVTDPSHDGSHLDLVLTDNANHSPVLNLLYWNGPGIGGWLTDGRQKAAIFLDCSRFLYDLQAKR